MQRTAERALQREDPFESEHHFTKWCSLVARRIVIDEWRRRERDATMPALSRDVADDVADMAVALSTRDAMDYAISQLPDAERLAIVGQSVAPGDRASQLRAGVARHRARTKLRAVFQGLAAAFGGRQFQFVRRLDAVGRISPEALVAVAGLAVMAAVGVNPVVSVQATDERASAVFAARQGIAADQGKSKGSIEVRSSVPVRGQRDVPAESPAGPVKEPYRDKTGLPAFSVPVPGTDGSSQSIDGRPSTEEDEGQLVCTATIVTPYGCVMSPVPESGD